MNDIYITNGVTNKRVKFQAKITTGTKSVFIRQVCFIRNLQQFKSRKNREIRPPTFPSRNLHCGFPN